MSNYIGKRQLIELFEIILEGYKDKIIADVKKEYTMDLQIDLKTITKHMRSRTNGVYLKHGCLETVKTDILTNDSMYTFSLNRNADGEMIFSIRTFLHTNTNSKTWTVIFQQEFDSNGRATK